MVNERSAVCLFCLHRWNINIKKNDIDLVVRCPKCGKEGVLFDPLIGWRRRTKVVNGE